MSPSDVLMVSYKRHSEAVVLQVAFSLNRPRPSRMSYLYLDAVNETDTLFLRCTCVVNIFCTHESALLHKLQTERVSGCSLELMRLSITS